MTGAFNEDDAIRLAENLRMGYSGASFTDAELSFIESWGGDTSDGTGTFFDTRITSAYRIEEQDGSELGQFTWPKLAALLRQQKAKRASSTLVQNDPEHVKQHTRAALELVK